MQPQTLSIDLYMGAAECECVCGIEWITVIVYIYIYIRDIYLKLTQSLEEPNYVLIVLTFITECTSNPRDGESLSQM